MGYKLPVVIAVKLLLINVDLVKIMRELIKLVSSAKTGHFYTTSKNKRKKPEKMQVKKYDPVVRKHVIYKEGKI